VEKKKGNWVYKHGLKNKKAEPKEKAISLWGVDRGTRNGFWQHDRPNLGGTRKIPNCGGAATTKNGQRQARLGKKDLGSSEAKKVAIRGSKKMGQKGKKREPNEPRKGRTPTARRKF